VNGSLEIDLDTRSRARSDEQTPGRTQVRRSRIRQHRDLHPGTGSTPRPRSMGRQE